MLKFQRQRAVHGLLTSSHCTRCVRRVFAVRAVVLYLMISKVTAKNVFFHLTFYIVPKRLVYLILISSIIRIFLASVLELSNDEVYYYLYALDLQPNYFDHPPGVGVLIRIFTLNLNLNHELFVRLGAIVCAAFATGLAYRLGTLLKNERTGRFATVLYTTGIYTSIIAGTFIIPDSPQVVLWLAALVVMFEIILKADNQEKVSFL